MENLAREIVQRRTAGEAVGITSVCSAHPLVIEAAIAQAAAEGSPVLIEATSNQSDQFGGYTGMTPGDVRDLVHRIADDHGLPREKVILGGDHLGPNTWREQGGDAAMDKADALIEAYVEAGFTKIHLDCSMVCAGDPDPIGDDLVAARAARLAAVAERTAARTGGPRPVYVVGTEVPVPGGAHETIDELTPTSADAARATLEAHRDAFAAAGVADAFERVMALVVQPGVEFDHVAVFDYDPSATSGLRAVLDDVPGLVFEAHSTDYQTPTALTRLVADGWAVLKVGPGLTFALREALFALARIEDEIVEDSQRSRLVEVVEEEMLAEPKWWKSYYEGSEAEQALARRYSYSDRVRYYWPRPAVAAAQQQLLDNLISTAIPLPLLSAHLPDQYTKVRDGHLALDPRQIAMDRVRDVLRVYSAATAPSTGHHGQSPRNATSTADQHADQHSDQHAGSRA